MGEEIMKFRKIMLLAIFLVSLLAVSAVSAADNATSDISVQSIDGDDAVVTSELEISKLAGENHYSGEICATQEDGLGVSSGSFTDLAKEIANAKSELNLKRDYTYTDADSLYKDGIEINKKITINGNGFLIKSKNPAKIFKITHNDVVLNNINFANTNHRAIDWEGSNGILNNCNFNNFMGGGAIYWYGDNGKISGCNFSHCSSSIGGAIYLYGDNSILTDCNFNNCYGTYASEGRSYGGAVDWRGNNGIMRNCTFRECDVSSSSYTYGGAVCWEGLQGILSDCNFIECYVSAVSGGAYSNIGSSYGGAVYWGGDEGRLSNCYFEDCYTLGGYRVSQSGSAVHWVEDYGILSNSTFANFNVDEGNVVNYFGDGCSLIDCEFIDCSAFDDSNIINWEKYALDGTLRDCSFIACSVEDGEIIHGINGANCKFLENANISSSSATVKYGEDATINVNLSSDATGEVTFTLDDKSKTVKVSNGVAKCTFSGLVGGIHDVLVSYSGNDKYAGRNIKTYIEVIRLNMSISTNPASAKYGENATVTVNLASDASGNVQFKINGVTYDTEISNGIAQCTVSNLNYGVYDVIISYSGNYKYSEAKAKTTLEVDKSLPIASVVVSDVGYGNNATVIVNLARNVTGNLEITVVNESKKAKITGNVVSGAFAGLQCGKYNVEVKYAGDLNYISQSEKTSFDVVKGTPIISVVTSDVSYGETAKITVNLRDGVNGYLNVTVNGKTENVMISDSKVICTLTGLEIGLYNVIVHYDGNDNYNQQTVEDSFNVSKAESVLTTSPVATVYNGNKYLVVYLRDDQGNVISGATVTVVLNGKTYTPTTDKNGQVKVSTNGLAPVKTYVAKITFKGNSKYDKSTKSVKINVQKANPKLTAAKKTFKRTVKVKNYAVVLKTNQNKAIKSAWVSLKVNKKTYKVKTNVKGQAIFKINNLVKKGTFNAVVKFAGNKYYNAKTVNTKIAVR